MILELQDARGRIDPRRARPEHGLDPMFGVERRWPHQRFVERHLAAQVGFGKRRPLVRRLALATNQDHVAVSALFAQRDGGRGASETRAEDDVPLGHYTSICRASPSTRIRYALTGTV